MYVCLDCRARFELPRRCVERHGLDSPPYEVFYACPRCCGTDYVRRDDEDDEEEEEED